MRLAALLLCMVLPATALCMTVYKAESPDGVVILSDNPIANGQHESTIELSDLNSTQHSSTRRSIKRLQKSLLLHGHHSHELLRQELLTQIAFAKDAIEKAQYQLVQAQVQKMKAHRECRLRSYRKTNEKVLQNYPECRNISTDSQENALVHARTHLRNLQQQLSRIG